MRLARFETTDHLRIALWPCGLDPLDHRPVRISDRSGGSEDNYWEVHGTLAELAAEIDAALTGLNQVGEDLRPPEGSDND